MDKLVIKAQKDKRIHDKLIAENEFFITKSEMQANLYSFKSNIWDKTENELIKFR